MDVVKGDNFVRFDRAWEIAFDSAIGKCFWYHIHKYEEIIDPGDLYVAIGRKCRECDVEVPEEIFALGELQKLDLLGNRSNNDGAESASPSGR